jgi:hypothetical protein
MFTPIFYGLVQENIYFYTSLLFITLVLYRLIFINSIKSVLDPLYFFVIFTNAVCTVDVIFLHYLELINDEYLYIYIVSEIGLVLGILIFSKKNISKKVNNEILITPHFYLFLKNGIYISFVVMLIPALVMYFFRGIPILLETRNDASGGGEGFGIFLRINQVANCVFILIYFIRRRIRKSSVENIMFYISIVIGILSGLKTYIFFYFFAYYIISNDYKDITFKNKLKIFLILLISVLSTFAISNRDINFLSIIDAVLMRVSASGDVYYLGLVNDNIYRLDSPTGFFHQMVGSAAASIRLIPWDSSPLNYGLELNRIVNGNDGNMGPTFRYNMLFLMFTKSKLMIFSMSLVIGGFIGFLRMQANSTMRFSVTFIVLNALYFKSIELIVGPDSAINSLFLFSIILLIICIIIICSTILNRKRLV